MSKLHSKTMPPSPKTAPNIKHIAAEGLERPS